MYVPEEQQKIIAEDLATLLYEGDLLVAFAKGCSRLYDEYDEYTADDIMLLTKKKFIELHEKNKAKEV